MSKRHLDPICKITVRSGNIKVGVVGHLDTVTGWMQQSWCWCRWRCSPAAAGIKSKHNFVCVCVRDSGCEKRQTRSEVQSSEGASPVRQKGFLGGGFIYWPAPVHCGAAHNYRLDPINRLEVKETFRLFNSLTHSK